MITNIRSIKIVFKIVTIMTMECIYLYIYISSPAYISYFVGERGTVVEEL